MADPYDTPGYRYSVNEFPGDGTTTDWSIQFSGRHPGYISIDHVRASIIAPNGTETLVPLSQENFVLPTLLRITPAVPAGSVLRVWRDTPKDEPLLDYNDGALLTERNLDRSFEQAVYAAAEMVDRSAESLADVEEFADAVLTRLGQVEDVADTALDASSLALSTSNAALSAAQEAVSTSNAALAGVEGATEAAILATDAANAANSAATLATTAANNATTAATDALATSQEAVDTATDALDVASGIAGTANNALTIANDALDVANGIAGTANAALSAANDAVSTANSAETVANATAAVVAEKIAIKPGNIDPDPAWPVNIPSVGEPDGAGPLNAQAVALASQDKFLRAHIDGFIYDLSDPNSTGTGAGMVGFRQPGGIAETVYQVLHRGFLAPEQFYLEADGDDWAPAFQRCANAAETNQLAVITLMPGKTYYLDDQVVIKHNSVWNCYGATMVLRQNPKLRGGFIRAQGSGTTIATGYSDRNNIVINGLIAVIASGVKGVNVFNTTCSHGVVFRDCVAIGARWALPSDPKPQGGRGFTCHSRTRRAKFINCRAYDCDIGYHILDKADTDYVETPNLTPTFTAGATTTGTVPGGHWLKVNDLVQCERYNGNWAKLNGNVYRVTATTSTTFTLDVDTTGFGTHDGQGRVSRADTGEFRDYNITFDECEAELCAISAITFEQVQQSQDVREPRRIKFTGRIKNCGTAYPNDQGVISLAGVPGLSIDVHIYQDSSHPIGSTVRGSTAQSEIKVRGYVHTCDIHINHNPIRDGGVGLEVGSTLHPEGTSRNNRYDFAVEGETLTGYLVWSPANQIGMTDNQNYTWANRYSIDYGYTSLPPTLVQPRARHQTNTFLLHDTRSGQTTVMPEPDTTSRLDAIEDWMRQNGWGG